MNYWQDVLAIFLFLLIIGGAYLTTKLLSNNTKRLSRNKYIHVLDRCYVSQDKHVLLLEVGGKGFLVGVTRQNMNVLGTLEEELLAAGKEEVTAQKENSSLQRWGNRVVHMIKKTVQAPQDLKQAREAYTVKNHTPYTRTNDKEDDISRILSQINSRESRTGKFGNTKGDGT